MASECVCWTKCIRQVQLVQIFNFLRQIHDHGLNDAISLQGGVEYVRNLKIDPDSNLVMDLKIQLPREARMQGAFSIPNIDLWYTGATWKFELKLGKRSGFQIIQDLWTVDVTAYPRDTKAKNHISKGCIEITKKRGYMHTGMRMSGISIPPRLASLFWHEMSRKQATLESPCIFVHLFPSILDFF